MSKIPLFILTFLQQHYTAIHKEVICKPPKKYFKCLGDGHRLLISYSTVQMQTHCTVDRPTRTIHTYTHNEETYIHIHITADARNGPFCYAGITCTFINTIIYWCFISEIKSICYLKSQTFNPSHLWEVPKWFLRMMLKPGTHSMQLLFSKQLPFWYGSFLFCSTVILSV
jgi:hypothetical protein